ncbi:MAG: aldehyde ferredoxin oxidoreductase [Candidatus Hydrothermota bacterium]|nr:MAG: aldehyde ferredoxin oxidoreductase [Candidatus Hydrothermae bacterium]
MAVNRFYGKILDIDLTRRSYEVKEFPEEWIAKFIGGKGLGAKILYDELKPGVDPLSPENILIFIPGPLSGTIAPTGGRWAIVTKSPHTGLYLDSQVGGHFAPKMRKTGYDIFVIRGRADKPVYLYVDDEKVEILDASFLWGKGIFETEDTLRQMYPGAEIGSIGPAGENLVTFALIGFNKYRHAGRGGAGAVMGSKNLKAVVVNGKKRLEYYDPKGLREMVRELNKIIAEHPVMKRRREIGTPMWVKMSNEGGFLPTKNFSRGVYEYADDISGERMRETIWVRNKACYACAIACGKFTHVREGEFKCNEVEGPEYETIALMGSNTETNRLDAIAYANRLCDDLGLDTITMGNVTGFAMELYERGLLKETDGLELRFGNYKAMIELIKKVAYREGIGELFSRGVRGAAEQIGQGSEKFAIHVKGLELPGVEPRGSWGMALAFATADRGGCHQRCWTPTAELNGILPRFSTEGVAKFVKEVQDERAACFSLVLCDFAPFDVSQFAKLLYLVTGVALSEEEYLKTGERIWNLTRMFNVREGISRKDDILPARIMEEPAPVGPAKGLKITKEILDKMLDEYYELRGWDKNGIPTEEKLKELGLI